MSKKHDEMTKLIDGTHSYRPDDAANLTALIAHQKEVIISLRAQLADVARTNGWVAKQSRQDQSYGVLLVEMLVTNAR